MIIRTVVAPALEPVTLAEFVHDRRLSSDLLEDAGGDAALEAAQAAAQTCISAARSSIESYTRRSLITRTLEVTFPYPSPPHCKREGYIYFTLPLGPIGAVVSVTDSDDTELDPESYLLDGMDRLHVSRDVLLSPSDAVVRYTAGYGAATTDVPEDLRRAVLREAATFWEHREDTVTEGGALVLSRTALALAEPYRSFRV